METYQKKKVVVVLTGAPGAGKSLFSQQVLSQSNSAVIEVDKLLDQLGGYDLNLIKESRKIALEKLELLLDQEYDYVLIDDNNHMKSIVQRYKKLAFSRSWKFLHVVIEPSLEECVRRNSMRDNPVSEQTLQNIYSCIRREVFYTFTERRSSISFENLIELIPVQKKEKILETVSIAHKNDLFLRNFVSESIQNIPLDQKKQFAKQASLAKKRTVSMHLYQHNPEEILKTFLSFMPSMYSHLDH